MQIQDYNKREENKEAEEVMSEERKTNKGKNGFEKKRIEQSS